MKLVVFLRSAAALALLALAGAPLAVAAAATPAAGVLSLQTPSLEFRAGPFFVANPSARLGAATCVPATGGCAVYALSVQLPDDYTATHPRDEILVTLDWDLPQADFDLVVDDGNVVGAPSSTSDAKPESLQLPVVPGRHDYQLQVYPLLPAGAVATLRIRLRSAAEPLPPVATGAPPRFQIYHAPTGVAVFAGEPTMDVNLRSNTPLFLAFLETLRLRFDDRTVPARASWENVSADSTRRTSQDPFLTTDPATGRSFVVQLALASSIIAFTDDDGATWTTSTGPGQPHGFDHPSLGIGPYPKTLPAPLHPLYPNAIYYCSQEVLTANCSRSDNGGLTFNPALPIYTADHCVGGHGFVTVAPDGAVYVPNMSCDNRQGFAVSEDAGLTWQVRTLATALAAIGTHPSLSFDAAGRLYFGYQSASGASRIAVSDDHGRSFRDDQDLGARLGLHNSVFQAVIGGDAGRAAMAFLGTATPGNYQVSSFAGLWYLYIATTYDGGASWHVVNATPNDPVQGPGGICLAGSTVCFGNRNLYDFNDIAVDAQGRILAAFADGCIGACVHGGHGTFSSGGAFARQSGGRRLFARFDPAEPQRPAAPLLSAQRDAGGVSLDWPATDDGGRAISGYRVYRAIAGGKLKRLTDTPAAGGYRDASATDRAARYRYAVSARNALGEGVLGNEVEPLSIDPRVACTAPGATVFDDAEDANLKPATPEIDIRRVSIAEPAAQPGLLVITLKMSSLPPVLPPGHHWQVTFDAPDGERYYVSADTIDSPQPAFVYGRYGSPGSFSTLTPLGSPDSVQANADGSLVFTIARSKVGSAGPGVLDAILALADISDRATVFDDAGPGRYTLLPAGTCAGT